MYFYLKKLKYLFAMLLLPFCYSWAVQLPELYKYKNFKCTFNKGVMWIEKENKLHAVNENMTFVIKSLDFKNKSAIFVGNQGTDKVFFYPTLQGIHFLETTPGGNVNHITIFRDRNIERNNNLSKRYPSVYSRHITFFLTSMPSQRYGYCEPFY